MGGFAWYVILCICLGCSIVLAGVEAFVINPWLKQKVIHDSSDSTIPSIRFDNPKTYDATKSGMVSNVCVLHTGKCFLDIYELF